MNYIANKTQKQEQKPFWKKEFLLNQWKQTHTVNSNYKVFAYPTEAKEAGYYTATEIKNKFKIKDFDKSQFHAIVPTGRVYTSMGMNFLTYPYLGIVKQGKDIHSTLYFIPEDFYCYYSLERLQKEQLLKNTSNILLKRKEGERGGNIPPNDIQSISEKIRDISTFSPFENQQKTDLLLTVPTDWWVGLNIPKRLNIHEMNYVLFLIACGMIFKRITKVPLKGKYLQCIIHPSRQKDTMVFLERNGLIECDHEYIKKSKCFHYWFSDKLKDRKFMSVYASPKIAEKWKKLQPQLTQVQQTIKDQMDFISIDEQEALLHAHEPSQVYIVEQVNKKNNRLDPDEYGRLHTNITNMNKESRKFLKIDGEECDEPDVSSCQVLGLAKLAKDEQIPGAEDLMALCERGEFYEAFQGDREKNKHKIITELLFGKAEYTHNSKLCQQFRVLFPKVYDWLLKIKKHNYKEMSHRLQKWESRIMIDLVGNSLLEQGIHFHPIYDSILCKKSDTEKVVATMNKMFQQEGMKAKVKVK